jgi:hypothetical protein
MLTPIEAPPEVPRAVTLTAWAAERLGWTFRVLDPEFGYLFELSDGQGWSRVCIGAKLPLNDTSASQLCADKHYSGLVLEDLGVRTPATLRVLSPRHFADTGHYADRLGLAPLTDKLKRQSFPLLVKPNRLSHGRRIAVVHDPEELEAACSSVFELDSIALVQELVHGDELRLDFLDGEYLIGYSRSPIRVLGDGLSPLGDLLTSVDPRCADPAWATRLLADSDVRARVGERLLDEVLPHGMELQLSGEILNLNRGGVGAPIADVPTKWLRWAVAIGERFGLRHFGLDLRVPGGLSGDPSEAWVLEVNSTPLVTQMLNLGHGELARAAWLRVVAALASPAPQGRPKRTDLEACC